MKNSNWSLDQCLFETFSKTPDKDFLVDKRNGITYSYSDAVKMIDLLVFQIVKLDVLNIALWLETSFEGICLFYAIIRAGKNPVLIDPMWGHVGILNIFKKLNLGIIVSSLKRNMVPTFKDIKVIELNFTACLSKVISSKSNTVPGNIIIFTSGTTSGPKGILLTQDNMRVAYEIAKSALDLPTDIIAGCFYRISGLGILGINFLFPYFLGGTSILMEEYTYVDQGRFNEIILNEKINFMYIVPPIVQFIINNYELESQYHHENILCVSGSSRLDALPA